MDLEALSTRANNTMRRSFISHFVGIVGTTNDKSTIYHSISIDHSIAQLDFNASKNVIRDLEVFKANLTNIEGNCSISAIFEASEILENCCNRWISPIWIGCVLNIE